MTEQLKPCPNPSCKSKVTLSNNTTGSRVECLLCWTCGPLVLWGDGSCDCIEQQAIEAWNLLPRSEWYSVDNKTPQHNTVVLIRDAHGFALATSHKDKQYDCVYWESVLDDLIIEGVTHWQYITPPQED